MTPDRGAAGGDAIDRLISSMRRARGGDALAPVFVVCPGGDLAGELQRRCALRGALVSVEFGSLGTLARRLAYGRSGSPPQPPWPDGADDLLAAALLAARPGSYFSSIADLPGTASALGATLAELAWHGVSPAAVRAAARVAASGRRSSGPAARAKLEEVADHLDGLLSARAGFASGASRYSAAIAAVERSPSSARSVVVAGRVEAMGLASRLVERLEAAGAAFVPPAPPPGPGRSAIVVAAAGEAAEAREALREALVAARDLDVPLGRIAIAPAVASARDRLVARDAGRLGIPVDGRIRGSLAGTPEGTALLDALDIAAAGFPRAATLALLRDRFVVPGAAPTSPPPDAAGWDRASREAGVVAGVACFRERLDAWASGDGVRRDDAEAARGLARAVEALAQDLPDPSAPAAWREHSARLLRFVRRWLAPSDRRDMVAASVSGLAGLDVASASADLASLRRTLARLLARTPVPAAPATPGGLLLVDVAGLPGRDLAACVLPGLAADAIPRAPAQDPILPDSDREALRKVLPAGAVAPLRSSERLALEKAAFERAVDAAAHRVVLLYPACDPATGRPRPPSPYLLDAVARIEGRSVAFDDIERRARGRHGARLLPLAPLERAGAASGGGVPARAALAAIADAAAPFVRAHVRAARSRWSRRELGPWAGDCSSSAVVRERAARILAGPLSASRLQSFASCPLQFLLRYVLRLRPLDEPADRYPFDSRAQGEVFHHVAETLFRALDAEGELPIRDVERASARAWAVAADALARIEAVVPPERLARFDADRAAFLEAIGPWVAYEAAHGTARRGAYEQPFGDTRGRSARGSGGPEVRVDAGENVEVSLGGFIDRADFEDGGEVVLVDYKTGRLSRDRAGLQGGRNLQLAVYALAARSLWPGRTLRRAAFRHVMQADGRVADVDMDRPDGFDDEVRRLLRGVVRGIAACVFPHSPSDGAGRPPCSYCDFALYCGPFAARVALARTKAGTRERAAALGFRGDSDGD